MGLVDFPLAADVNNQMVLYDASGELESEHQLAPEPADDRVSDTGPGVAGALTRTNAPDGACRFTKTTPRSSNKNISPAC